MAEPAAPAPDTATPGLEAAHRALMSRHDLQFDLPGVVQAPPREAPHWLTALLKFLGQIFSGFSPVLQVLFWVAVVAAVLALVYLIVRELGWLEWTDKARKKGFATADYRPDADVAQAMLADADALAARGLFAEAIHTLLLRSIEDMGRFRPGSVRPAATSRDLAELEVLPAQARPAFASMAQRVETSLFGARPVDAGGYARARADYEAFAFPKVWA